MVTFVFDSDKIYIPIMGSCAVVDFCDDTRAGLSSLQEIIAGHERLSLGAIKEFVEPSWRGEGKAAYCCRRTAPLDFASC